MKASYEKDYALQGIRYKVRVFKCAPPLWKKARLCLFDIDWDPQCRAYLWSDIYPLANMESLADNFFRKYKELAEHDLVQNI